MLLSRLNLLCLTGAVAISACFGEAQANTLSQDFDSGSLNVAASSVSGSLVQLVGRKTWTDPVYSDTYRWVYFRADGVQGLTPQFRVDASSFLGSLSGHRYIYSYDQSAWGFFDQGSISGADYVFQNNSPFIQDQVYVAYALPYPVSRTESRMAVWGASPYVTPTPSASNQFVLGHSAGGIDDSGRPVPSQPLYGLRITDPTAIGPKQLVLLASGAHSAETTGSHVLEGMVDFLLSNDIRASQLRSRAEFFVYPQVNPDGRFGGYYRSNPENPDKDFNRYFNNPAGFTDLSMVTSAMRADTGGDIDYLLDFHSWWGPWNQDNFIFTVSNLTNSPFLQALAAREPTLDVEASSGTPGMLRIWGMSSAGLRAQFAYTPEFGFHAFVGEDRYDLYGTNFALALLDTLGAPVRCDLNADLLCNVLDVDLLTSVGDLTAGVSGVDPKYDLIVNGIVDQADLVEWLGLAASFNGLALPYRLGDANLDQVVDAQDFAAWNDAKFTTGTVWHQGDFNGDGRVDGVDFSLWNQHKATSASGTVMVPEPVESLTVFLLAAMAASKWPIRAGGRDSAVSCP
jgi:hypothetical protein